MRLVIQEDYEQVSEYVAEYVARRINDFEPTARRPFVIGLPTGSSPLGTYRKLVELYKAGSVSFQHVVTFNMDEYVNLPEDSDQSYHYFMHHNFFRHLDIPKQNINMLNGNAADLEEECEQYEAKIKAYGGIELFLGGIGTDGHIAFNEPGSSLGSRTRIKTLAYDTIVDNARFFGGDLKKVPRQALTVGVATIMDAREVLIIINGKHKAYALKKALANISHLWTVSAIQLHQHAMVVCDDDATLELKVKTVRYFKSLQDQQREFVDDLRSSKDHPYKEDAD